MILFNYKLKQVILSHFQRQMTDILQDNLIHPPGPTDAYDINTTDDSFLIINKLLAEYGDIVRIKSSTRRTDSYLINNPEFIKHILLKNYQNYKKGVGFERVKMLLGNGIITSDGAFWRKQRRMIQPAFSKAMIESQVEMVQKCNTERMQKWQGLLAGNESVEIDISYEASDLALDIVMRVLFSDDVDTMLEESGENPFAFLTEDPTRDIKVVLKYRSLMSLLLKYIQARRNSTKKYNDFVSVFVDARDKDTGEGMTDKELLDEVMTMIVAGHETSAITLTWVWYFMAKYPHIDKAVQDEIIHSGIVGAPGFNDLEKIPYIKQVTEEALRIYPPVWLFTRKAIEDDRLGEYNIPAGSDIFLSPYYLHRNKAFWDDPESFRPERFSADLQKQQHKFSYLPFSAGPRRCIGDFFATVEMQIHVGLIAQKFRFELITDAVPELEASINMRAKDPIILKMYKR